MSISTMIRLGLATFLVFAIATGLWLVLPGSTARPEPVSAAADIISVASGDWSDPSIWSSGAVPTDGDNVTIGGGHIVNYNVASNAVLGKVYIDGVLYFSRNTDTRIKVSDNFLVRWGGFLNMGRLSRGLFGPLDNRPMVLG